MTTPRLSPLKSSARALLWLAAACGLVHAAFSAYWAFGGLWLTETVGQWALDWYRSAPASAMAVLLVIAEETPPALYGPYIDDVPFPYAVALLLTPALSPPRNARPAVLEGD